MMIGSHCDQVRGFHSGQYGCRTGRSVVDAVGVTIAQVQRRGEGGASSEPC